MNVVNNSLVGRTAIVTGGSGGIGREICIELCKRGCSNLIMTYKSNKQIAVELCDYLQIIYNTNAIYLYADGEETFFAASSIVKFISENYPNWKIDIIVNNAGIDDLHLLSEVKQSDFEKIMKINLYFPISLVKESIKLFGPFPRIINISSISARLGGISSIAYSSSKGALESATKVMAQELGQTYNATVNCVNPGPVDTKMWQDSDPAIIEGFGKLMSDTPAGNRIGTPNDIAQIVGFLAEEGSRWVSGQTICGNGGLLLN